jgi:hypothetical protein
MTTNRKITFAALAALLALPLGVTAFQAVNTAPAQAQTAKPATTQAAPKHKAEVPDTSEPDAGKPDLDKVQEGPGNTADGDRETNDDKNAKSNEKSDGDGETAD